MDEKTTTIITTLVSIIGLAVAISKETREWYKATKKKNVNYINLESTADNVFQLNEGKDNFPPLNYILIERRTQMKSLILLLIVFVIINYAGGDEK